MRVATAIAQTNCEVAADREADDGRSNPTYAAGGGELAQECRESGGEGGDWAARSEKWQLRNWLGQRGGSGCSGANLRGAR